MTSRCPANRSAPRPRSEEGPELDQIGVVIAFWGLAAMTVGSAALIILARNLLHAVLLLILSFVGMAGLFITLSADFVGVVQVLIYAGAIAVLMIFAVMLTPRADRNNAGNKLQLPALALSGLLTTGLIFVILQTDWRETAHASFAVTAAAIGDALLKPFVLPFEIASVLLVIAMIGAIVLVSEE